MIERSEDGSLHPIVMDFGLARESTEGHGLTESGAVMGTPAYMAPEQARGETRLIDRRSDVYSLGATLYDLIVGIPPFDAESVVDILLQVISEDAKPLRTAVSSVPLDLETIVMKCLNKEPNQRYDSAKALADDLGRYINGEPILGRRVSLIYRARRWTKRHRTLFLVSAVSAVLLIGLAGSSIRQTIANQRERKRLAAQTVLEQELTQQIKDMEWFLRTAYQLPLHDIGEEQAIIRQRMAALPQPSAVLGERGMGLVHYTRGRGHLALHETSLALKELRLAQEQGVDNRELHYALGRVLGDLYNQAMEEARRQGDKLWLEGRQKELEKEYLQPALAELERSRGLQLDSPDYLEGMIAYYGKHYDDALALARKAQSHARWLYEARQLEGDVLLTRGTDLKEHGQYDVATKSLHEAIEAYKVASDIGRSDASIYESIAEAFIQESNIARNSGKPTDEILKQALAYSENAIAADRQRSSGFTKKAYALFWMAWRHASSNQDPRNDVKQILAAGAEAVKNNPKDVYAYDAMGNSFYCQARYEMENSIDPLPSLSKGALFLHEAIARSQNFPWASSDLSLIYTARGKYLYSQGQDPTEDYQKGIELLQSTLRIAPDFINGYGNLLNLYSHLTEYYASIGKDPRIFANTIFQLADKVLKINKNQVAVLTAIDNIRLHVAKYMTDAGIDPTPMLAPAEELSVRIQEIVQDQYWGFELHAKGLALKARYVLLAGSDPSSYVTQGLTKAQACLDRDPEQPRCLVCQAQLKLVAAEWSQKQHSDAIPLILEAVTSARRSIQVRAVSVEASQELAHSLWMLAQLSKTRKATALLLDGVTEIERALKMNPNQGYSHAIRAELLLGQAQQERQPKERQELARQAKVGFERALALNPLLKRQYGKYLEQAMALSQ